VLNSVLAMGASQKFRYTYLFPVAVGAVGGLSAGGVELYYHVEPPLLNRHQKTVNTKTLNASAIM